MHASLRLLAIHAHPDDESLGTGGTLARYASEGVETTVVYGTRGEEGEILNPEMGRDGIPDDITWLRMEELGKAREILGIHRVFFLGYRDSGMAGRDSNAHPEALHNADLDEATRRLVAILREVRPQVVITYNERGGYGHPDHIAVHRIGVAAFDASGDPARYPDIPWPVWQPKKLYFTANPRSRLLRRKQILESRGETVQFDIDLLATPDEEITTWIDVSAFVERKLAAILCHRSQIGPRSFLSRVGEPERTRALSTECFVCARGCPPDGTREEDLFQGIRGESG